MPGRQKICFPHWPGIQPAALTPGPAGGGSAGLQPGQVPTYLAPLRKHSEATMVKQLHGLRPRDLPGPGWRQLHLWAVGRSVVCPSLWGWEESGSRGEGLRPHFHAGAPGP